MLHQFTLVVNLFWMRRILKEFGLMQIKSNIILCDNSLAIKLSKNLVLHGQRKRFWISSIWISSICSISNLVRVGFRIFSLHVFGFWNLASYVHLNAYMHLCKLEHMSGSSIIRLKFCKHKWKYRKPKKELNFGLALKRLQISISIQTLKPDVVQASRIVSGQDFIQDYNFFSSQFLATRQSHEHTMVVILSAVHQRI